MWGCVAVLHRKCFRLLLIQLGYLAAAPPSPPLHALPPPPPLCAVMRDRNLELPWRVLHGVLDRIAVVNGSTSVYQQLAASGSNVIKVPARTPGQSPAPPAKKRTEVAQPPIAARLERPD